ncbi:MAG: hypothetical protein WA210_09950, partial [Burkholderiaceae bacterium]
GAGRASSASHAAPSRSRRQTSPATPMQARPQWLTQQVMNRPRPRPKAKRSQAVVAAVAAGEVAGTARIRVTAMTATARV